MTPEPGVLPAPAAAAPVDAERAPWPLRTGTYVALAVALLVVAEGWPSVARRLGIATGRTAAADGIAVLGAVAGLVAAAVVLRVAARESGRARLGWGGVGAGAAVVAVGTIAQVATGATLEGTVSAHGAGPLQLVGLVVMMVGALAFPSSVEWTSITQIDVVLVGLAGVALMWLAPLRGERGPEGGLSQVLAVEPWAGVAVALILVGATMLVRCTPGGRPGSWPLVLAVLSYPAGIYTAIVGMTAHAPSAASMRVAEIWWLVGPVLLGCAGARRLVGWRTPGAARERRVRGGDVLPAVATLVTLVCVAAHQRILIGIDPTMLAIGVLTVVLAAARVSLLQADQARLQRELQSLADELAGQALRDELTGLGNRLALEHRLADALVRPSQHGVSVFFIDVDNFKTVNDALGHRAGDELLVEVALRLTDVLGDGVFRIGGDEFVAVREDLDAKRAEDLAGALVAALSLSVTVDGRMVAAAASVGLARSAPRAGGDGRTSDDADALLRRADLALYRAKELGRARAAVYDGWLQERADRRLSLQQGLARAATGAEFEVRYQPIVELATGTVVGAEAVARWRTEDHGLLLPEEFLPLAADAGLLPEIGRSVLRASLADVAAADLPDDVGFRLSVNLSPQVMASPTVVDDVARALADSGLSPGRLRLEVSEKVVVDPTAAPTLDRLVALGVGLTVQEFGTASSSLRRLGRFPDPTIKVDRSFVAGLGRRSDDQLILEAVAQLAAELGFRLAADGVQQEAQAEELLRLGASEAQGWLFGPAVGWDQLVATHLTPPVEQGA